MQESGDVFSFLCPSRRVSYPGGCPTPLRGVLKLFSLALIEVYVLCTGKVCWETDHKQPHLKRELSNPEQEAGVKSQSQRTSPDFPQTAGEDTMLTASTPFVDTHADAPPGSDAGRKSVVRTEVLSYSPRDHHATQDPHQHCQGQSWALCNPTRQIQKSSTRWFQVASDETKPLLANTIAIPCQRRANPPHEPHQSSHA